MLHQTRGGRTASTARPEESGNLQSRVGKTYSDRKILKALQNAAQRSRERERERETEPQGGMISMVGGSLQNSPILLQRAARSTSPDTALDNERVQLLMGMYQKNGKATAETAFSKPDRSAFSCERYQFFLDAPFEICNMCCNVMKKNPAKAYTKKTNRYPMTAEMADESRLRKQKWLKYGCNGFDMKAPKSMPMAFWTEQDVLQYIYRNDLPICEIYGDVVVDYEKMGQLEGQMSMFIDDKPLKTTGAYRTGCVFCGFGLHLERNPNRLEQLKVSHPELYEWIMRPWDDGGLGYKEVIDWINEHGNMNIKY